MHGISGQTSDAQLIVGSIAEPRQFAAVFDRHYERIRAYLSRRIDSSLAEELASETFVRAFAARATYDAQHPVALPWLYGIATNLVRRHVRSEERRRRAFARAAGSADRDQGSDGLVERVDASRQGPALAAALERLSPVDRDALLLLALTELDYEGIGVAMGVPVGTIRSRLHRARRELRRALTEIDQSPDSGTNRRNRI